MPVKDLVTIALGAALVAAFGLLPPIPLPPLSVPITAQSLAIMLVGSLFGGRKAFLALGVFLLLVAAGLPLLPGGRGGLGSFVNPTSGYLIGYLFGAGLIGFFYDRFRNHLTIVYETLFLIVGGIILIHACGISWLTIGGYLPFGVALKADMLFIPGDLVKVALTLIISRHVRKALPQMFR